MSRLDEIMRLADEAKAEHRFSRFNLSTLEEEPIITPPVVCLQKETVRQMVELIRMQHEALLKADDIIYSEYCGTDCQELQTCKEAISAFERFDKGE